MKHEEVTKVSAIEEFLKIWYDKAIEYHKPLLDEFFVEYDKMMELHKSRTRNYSYKMFDAGECTREQVNEEYLRNEKIGKEVGDILRGVLDKLKNEWKPIEPFLYSPAIVTATDNKKVSYEKMYKMIANEATRKKINLVKRVEKKIGKITDARLLTVGMDSNLNGVVVGEKGKAFVTTIDAGGYNIQTYHYRVLVQVIKE